MLETGRKKSCCRAIINYCWNKKETTLALHIIRNKKTLALQIIRGFDF